MFLGIAMLFVHYKYTGFETWKAAQALRKGSGCGSLA